MRLLLASLVLGLAACATTPGTAPTALDATYAAGASIDGAIKAADVAVNAGTLKGPTAANTIRALGVAKASVQAAIAAQVAGATK